MKKGIIVQGDPTTGGGEVLVGSGYMIDGETIAVLGDPVSCKNPFHVAGNIVEGDENLLANGKPVALHGHKVSCGCTLISTKLPALNFVDKPVTASEKNQCFFDKRMADFAEKDKQQLDAFINSLNIENLVPDFMANFAKSFLKSFLNVSKDYGRHGPNYGAKLLESLSQNNSSRCEVIINSEIDKQKKLPASTQPPAQPQQKKIIYTQSGKKGAWNKSLNNPEPNTIYVIDNKFKYETDDLNRVIVAENVQPLQVSPSNPDKRNSDWQSEVGASGGRGKDKKGRNKDDGGHYFANQFGGGGEKLNLTPQDRKSNRSGEWRQTERRWANESKAGNKVHVKIEPVYVGNSVRPTKFIVTEKIIDGKTGKLKVDRTFPVAN